MFLRLTAFALACFALVVPAAAQQKMELWYWHHSYLTSASAVQSSEALIDQAAAAGYTGLALWDTSINALNLPGWPTQNVDYLKQVIQYANAKGLKVMPLVAPYGHSGDVLRRNPNWAEGQRVTGTQLRVDAAGQTLQVINSFAGLTNGGFEAGATGWFSYGDAGTVLDTSVSHTGQASGLISGALNPSANARFFQVLNVIPWRQYHLRMYLKTQNFSGFSQVQIFDSANWAINKIDHPLNLPANQDWTAVDLTFNSGASSTLNLLMGVWGGNSGNLWFDDISLEETALVYVLRRPGTPLSIYDPANRSSVYTEGTDFNSISDPKFASNPTFSNDNWHQPMTITLPAGTRLRPGQVVAMEHYAVQPVYDEAVGVCLTDAGMQGWMADNAKAVAAVFPAGGGYLFGHDEMRHMNSCASCKAKNLTPGQLLAWSLGQTLNLFNTVSPGAPVYIWSDMFDPYHNAHDNFYFVEGDIAQSWQGLPSTVAVMNWNLNNLKNSATWFSGADPKQPTPHKQTIAGFYDGGDAAAIARNELTQVAGVPGITGMMYTTWRDDYSQLKAFADAARLAWPAYQSSVAPVAVTITPTTASLTAGGTQQFTAAVTGSSNTGVTWSMAPAVGSLSSSGLYTAPAVVSAAQSLVVTATSVADGSKAASATLTLNPPPAGASAVYRVYAGTAAYTDALGNVWSPDGPYAQGGSTASSSAVIANTASAPLYQSYRSNWIDFGYHFPVANGTYAVRLLFAETQNSSQGQRVFSVQLNGQKALTNFDVLAAAGGANTAVSRAFAVTVTGGSIDLQLQQLVASPMLSAIEITAPAVVVAPARVTLGAGQTAQFSGPAGAAWSVAPALGSISAGGVYTAPGSIASFEQVTVTATSGAQSASATVALNPASGAFAPIRVNAGGGDLVDAQGQVWAGDTGFSGGYFSATPNAIANTAFPALYQAQRWFYTTFQYQFAVPNGSRVVRLKFAETVASGAGQRWFNVGVNSVPALTNFDIAAQAGGANRAVDVDVPVSVTGGQVTIQITPVHGNAVLNGIEIIDASAVSVAVSPGSASLAPGGTQQFAATVSGSSNTAVTWSIAPAVGSISATGLYSAPATVTTAQTVTVTATSAADATKAASAPVTLNPPPAVIGVTLTPGSASLNQGGTQQFAATVTGTSNTAVTWTLAPAVGSVSLTGLYTAPATVTTAQTVTVTATSAADASKSASASVTVNPPPAATAAYRVYAGAVPYTDVQGRVWNPDAAYVNAGTSITGSGAVANTANPALYQSYRYNWTDFTYHFAVANGSYLVKLQFAETQYTPQGVRVFGVKLNGQSALTNLDVVAAAGGANTALDRVFAVTVTSGAIDISLTQLVGNPMLSAVEITSAAFAIAPARVALGAGQSVQLQAPAGAAWSLSPAIGSLSATGMYTAPASVASFEQVTVTASAGGQSASATLTLNPAAGTFAPIRINAGGGDLVDTAGQVWAGDTGFSGGYFSATPSAIANTPFAALYQGQRWFYTNFQYQFAVPSGAHTVRLKFAEIVASGPGQRSFNVTVNGVAALTNYDIAAQAGGVNRAVDVDVPVSVTNGLITILITPVHGNAVINGIEIL